MKKSIMISAGFVGIAAPSGCIEVSEPAPAQAQPAVGSSTDLTAFQGARAGQAENGIQNGTVALFRRERT